MRRIVALAISLAVVPLAATAQRQYVPRLGVLGIDAPMSPGHVAFLDELRSLGYLEGRTITIRVPLGRGTSRPPAHARG